VVGGGAGRALDRAPVHDDDDRDPVALGRLPHRRLGQRPLQRDDHAAVPLRRLAGGKATDAGARLLTSTVATGLVRDGGGRVVGVRTDRDGAELLAPVVIAADGVNSFLAKEAGLLPRAGASHHTLGVKEVLDLRPGHQRAVRRAGPRGRRHGDPGCTRDIPGGGFLYTNADSVSIGVVLSLPELGASGVRPEALIADLKAHPALAPLLRGATLREYGAHLIPEGGTTPCRPWPRRAAHRR